jgi:hypothetical protein
MEVGGGQLDDWRGGGNSDAGWEVQGDSGHEGVGTRGPAADRGALVCTGVGIVKRKTTYRGSEMTYELKSFTPGK